MGMSVNVGSQMHPLSALHEHTVEVLFDELSRRSSNLLYVRLSAEGELSGNLKEGAAEVRKPGEWDQVGGVVPDLILYNIQGDPVRIIEVIVTNPPDSNKKAKLARLRKRGMDIVEIEVKSQTDLRKLFPMVQQTHNYTFEGVFRAGQLQGQIHNGSLEDIISAIRLASPAERRELSELLMRLNTTESLVPVRPKKRDFLWRGKVRG